MTTSEFKHAIVTFRGVTHPWLCDVMGHLTTRNYLAMFDDASYHFMASLQTTPPPIKESGLGWADVKQEIEYLGEIRQGELTVVRSVPIRVGTKSITFANQLSLTDFEDVKATCVTTSVRFDLNARKAVPIDADIKGALEKWIDGDRPS
ncbi:MAG: thioesterase family protein [Pseudomonadota bacterium]